MTTPQEWVDGFRSGSLTITGVTRHYNEPPQSLSTADLPAAWPESFSVGYGGRDWSCDVLNEVASMSFLIACEAVGQSRMPGNYEMMIDMATNARTALNGLNDSLMIFVQPSIRVAIITVAGNSYFGLVCTIEGSNGGV